MARKCEICGTEYSSGASYRVHKSRYHRAETPNSNSKDLPVQITANPESEEHEQEIAPEQKKSREAERNRKGGDDWFLAAASGVAAVILLLLFGGRK